MAALDFPLVPNTESEVTTGDITWKWNGYAWYAASQGDDVYLSKVTDDEAAGAITFKAMTTHEGGVRITGGSAAGVEQGVALAGSGELAIVNNSTSSIRISSDGEHISLAGAPSDTVACYARGVVGAAGSTSTYYGFAVNSSTVDDFQGNVIVFSAQTGSSNSTEAAKIGSKTGFNVPSTFSTGSNAGQANYGFKSEMNTLTRSNNYGFYAGGSASNYFAGGVQFDTASGTTALNDYEEGEWTPTVSGQTFNVASERCRYVKIGAQVTCWVAGSLQGVADISTGDTFTIQASSFPFSKSSSHSPVAGGGGATNSGNRYWTMNKNNVAKCISSNGGATNAMYFAFTYHTNA